jgi:hypothetical protein
MIRLRIWATNLISSGVSRLAFDEPFDPELTTEGLTAEGLSQVEAAPSMLLLTILYVGAASSRDGCPQNI